MSAHLVERKKGEVYAIVLTVGRKISSNGKSMPVQKWITFHGTKAEAKKAMIKILHEQNTGEFVDPSKMTTGEWLNYWIDSAIKNSHNKKPRTKEAYEYVVKKHLIPALGSIPLQKLKPMDIQGYYNRSTLAAATLEQHHVILFQALKYATDNEHIPQNPAGRVTDKPKARKKNTQKTWTTDEIKSFLDQAKSAGTRCEAFYRTALETGMRRGELCGLKWSSVNLEDNIITVEEQLTRPGTNFELGTTKTSAVRTVTVSDQLIDLLKLLKSEQDETKKKYGQLFKDFGFVFTKLNGYPLQSNNIGQREFSRLITNAGVSKIRIHDLRHTSATLLLENKVNIKVVQERLGHADIRTTLQTYAHVTQNMQKEAAQIMGDLITNGEDRESERDQPESNN